MEKEFLIMKETLLDTQKKISTWVTSGYEIEIVAQFYKCDSSTNGSDVLITSLWKIK